MQDRSLSFNDQGLCALRSWRGLDGGTSWGYDTFDSYVSCIFSLNSIKVKKKERKKEG